MYIIGDSFFSSELFRLCFLFSHLIFSGNLLRSLQSGDRGSFGPLCKCNAVLKIVIGLLS